MEPASQSPISRENIIKQLSKLGESAFQLSAKPDGDAIKLDLDDGVFYSLKLLNELRRTAVNALEEELIGGDFHEE